MLTKIDAKVDIERSIFRGGPSARNFLAGARMVLRGEVNLPPGG